MNDTRPTATVKDEIRAGLLALRERKATEASRKKEDTEIPARVAPQHVPSKESQKKAKSTIQEKALRPVPKTSQVQTMKAKEEELKKKYPHVITGTLRYDDEAGKLQVRIKCTSCGNTERKVYTSDLWQVKVCKECYRKGKLQSRKEKEAVKEKKSKAKK